MACSNNAMQWCFCCGHWIDAVMFLLWPLDWCSAVSAVCHWINAVMFLLCATGLMQWCFVLCDTGLMQWRLCCETLDWCSDVCVVYHWVDAAMFTFCATELQCGVDLEVVHCNLLMAQEGRRAAHGQVVTLLKECGALEQQVTGHGQVVTLLKECDALEQQVTGHGQVVTLLKECGALEQQATGHGQVVTLHTLTTRRHTTLLFKKSKFRCNAD